MNEKPMSQDEMKKRILLRFMLNPGLLDQLLKSLQEADQAKAWVPGGTFWVDEDVLPDKS